MYSEMKIHYLDNSATTAVCEAAARKAYDMMTVCYGNPSSLHGIGIEAEREVEAARGIIARSLSADAKNIIFTSGGTEANNLALFGAADALKRRGDRIIVSAVEHPSVRESAKRLAQLGFDVHEAPVGSDGVIIMDELTALLNSKTILVSVMAVNNETGSVQPTELIAKAVHRLCPDALFHVDAVQAYCKTPLKPKKLSADLMSVSAHKIHGPKGIGALYIREGARLSPLLYGGEQQHKLRPGTESSPLIAAFGAAAAEADIPADMARVRELESLAREGLRSIDGVQINSPDNALPCIVNFSVSGIRSEIMLHFLESRGVYVSSSSACSKGKPSYVLSAMGLPAERVDSSLRASFSRYSSTEDVQALIEGVREGVRVLQKR